MKKILMGATFLISLIASAQKIELIGLRMYKAPVENIERMEITLMLTDSVQLVSLASISNIQKLTDDTGTNLLAQIPKSQQPIHFERSQLVKNGLGILIDVYNIPSKEASKIKLEGVISYHIIDSEIEKSVILEGVDFNKLDKLMIENESIQLRKGHFNDSKKGSMISFRFKNNNRTYHIEDIKVIENNEIVDEAIQFNSYTNNAMLAIPESLLTEKYTLKITYGIVKMKTIPLEKEFGLGL